MAQSKQDNPSAGEGATDTFLTLAEPSQGLYKEKGSKFLAFAYPVETETQIKAHLETLRKEYYDARHHCYAYVLGTKQETYRVNDDGEPSGTAGRPIHGQILSRRLTDILVVVVRYFGGTKLGTSGLINAYKTATADALQQAKIEERIVMRHHEVRFPYEEMNKVMRIVKDLQLKILGQEAGERCELRFAVRQAQEEMCLKKFREERLEII